MIIILLFPSLVVISSPPLRSQEQKIDDPSSGYTNGDLVQGRKNGNIPHGTIRAKYSDFETPDHAGCTDDPDIIYYDFGSGELDWNGEWDTNGGNDDYKSFYRVYRLRGGYLIRDHNSSYADSAHDYFNEQVDQIIRPFDQNGFWDVENKCWIKKLLWSDNDGWYGMVPHSWKYSLELEEGAFMAAMISGNKKMGVCLARELEYIHARIAGGGIIEGLDVNLNLYEYGLLLSSLALGARYFKDRNVIGLFSHGDTAYADMEKVDNHIRKNCESVSNLTKGSSSLLKGLTNAYLAYHEYDDPVRQRCVMTKMKELVSIFIKDQETCGRFRISNPAKELTPVQQQLKADIALMLAYKVTGDSVLLTVVKNNLDWIIANRWDLSEKNMGGIIWSEEDTTSFFECHQMWFLTAAKYLEEESDYDYSSYRASAFAFLTDDNGSAIDTYVHNLDNHGGFFSYRAISADGTIQKEPAHKFKGAYEIGASLWAMALNHDFYYEGHTWLMTQSPADEANDWDKAIFTAKNFGTGNMKFQWDVKFRDIDSEGAYTGLFNDQSGDWRILFDTVSGLHYKNIYNRDAILVDKPLLRSNEKYTLRIIKSGDSRIRFILSEDEREIHNSERSDVMTFDACHFGALQLNSGPASAKNIYIDNISCAAGDETHGIYKLSQNFPNPFNSHTAIEFDVGARSRVKLAVYDLEGRLVKRLIDGIMESKSHTISWDGKNECGRSVESGVYFYRLEIGDLSRSRKMVLLR